MKNNYRCTRLLYFAAVFSLCATTSANAALVSRLGGQAYYDTVLDITWLADANYAKTSGYDTDGLMTWADANAWAASLTISGISGWRLPDVSPVDGASYDYNFSHNGSTDYGYNISAPGSAYPSSTVSEMAYMFYSNLGNIGLYDATGMVTSCSTTNCLTNTGPFTNIQFEQPDLYWSATVYALEANMAWDFYFAAGLQTADVKDRDLRAWVVHAGDVAAVPIPAAFWLLGSGLVGLFGFARKNH